MPETTNLNIVIDANGGSAAAAEVNKVVGSFNNIRDAHEDIKSRFTQRFEHAGVHIFGRDLLGMIGATGEARAVLPVLSLAVSEAADSFGLASAALGPWVFGLAALVALIAHVVNSHKEHADALAKVTKQQQEAFKATHELMGKISEYRDVVGTLPNDLKNLEAATKSLDEVERQHAAHSLGESLAAKQRDKLAEIEHKQAIEASIEAVKQRMAWLNKDSDEQKGLAESIKAYNRQLDESRDKTIVINGFITKATSDIKAMGKGFLDTADELDKEGKAALRAAEAHDKLTDIMAKNAEESKKAAVEFSNFSQKMADKISDIEEQAGTSKEQTITRTYDKMREEVDREYAHEQQLLLAGKMTNAQYYVALEQMNAQHEQAKTAINRTENAKRLDNIRAMFQAERSQSDIAEKAFTQTVTKMSVDWSQHITNMVFEGEKWKVTFTDLLKDVVKEFFQAMVQMEIRYAAFSALTGMGFLGGGGRSIPAGLPGFAGGFANGFEGTVNGPTLFLAGEAGPESVSITPMAKSPSSAAQVSTTAGSQSVSIGDIHVHGVQDPKKFADMVGQEIITRIRGRGELDFRRTA